MPIGIAYETCTVSGGAGARSVTSQVPQYHMVMYDTFGKGVNPFSAPTATLTTTNENKFVAWVMDLEAKGWVQEQDHQAHIDMLRMMPIANALAKDGVFVRVNSRTGKKVVSRKDYDPAVQANRPSGNGQKPMRKPTRDYKGSQMPKGPWEPIRTKW